MARVQKRSRLTRFHGQVNFGLAAFGIAYNQLILGPLRYQPASALFIDLVAMPVTIISNTSEKDAELAQKLGQLQPFLAVFPRECVGQLASFGPT